MSGGEHYQVNGGGYDEILYVQGVGHVSGGKHYQVNGGVCDSNDVPNLNKSHCL